MPQQTIHVLVNDQRLVVRAYRNLDRAKEDLALVEGGGTNWQLVDVPLVGGRARNGKKKGSTPRRAAASSSAS